MPVLLSSLPHEDRKAVQACEHWGQLSVRYAIYIGFVGSVYVLIALRLDGGGDVPEGHERALMSVHPRCGELMFKSQAKQLLT